MSTTHGYSTTGAGDSGAENVIQRYSFSSDAGASDWADLFETRRIGSGNSSTTYGYAQGGVSTSVTVDKFSLSAQANATDVGNLTVGGYGAEGYDV